MIAYGLKHVHVFMFLVCSLFSGPTTTFAESLRYEPVLNTTLISEPREESAQTRVLSYAVVIDRNAGTNARGGLFRVDVQSGSRKLLSDFGDSKQGSLGRDPSGVTIGMGEDLLIVDAKAGTRGLGALFRVNPKDGARVLLSDFGNVSQGALGGGSVGGGLAGIAMLNEESILVSDIFAGSGGALFRVNLETGIRTLLIDFGDGGHSLGGVNPRDVMMTKQGEILIVVDNGGTNAHGALLKINPLSGKPSTLSDFGNTVQGPLGKDPTGIVVESSGSVLVIDFNAGTRSKGALFRVNPKTGIRILLSDFGDSSQGPTGDHPVGVTLDKVRGDALVIDDTAMGRMGERLKGMLFRVNPQTGRRSIVSDFGASETGHLGNNPTGIVAGK